MNINNAKLLLCPICKGVGDIKNGSFICRNGHCFDISKTGYINFSPSFRNRGYDKQLYQSRKIIFSQNFYKTVAQTITDIIENHIPHDIIIDAGCGEGYFSQYISSKLNTNIIAFDIEKDAVLMASKQNKDISWIVGDINNIPLKEDSANILLNILTPANYNEFKRLLKKDGLLIKVIPGKKYLQEIRENMNIQKEKYSGEKVEELFHRSTTDSYIKEICCEFPTTKEQSDHFFKMTPLTQFTDNFFNPTSKITINLKILVGKCG